ncbi:MAG TPA: hypothetical protein VFB13_12835 [Reyranella sp.]|nr:hypothetical protein [Reyranella sp.]
MLEATDGDTRHYSLLGTTLEKDHITAMRKMVLPVLLLLAAAGCAPALHWAKPGADEAMALRESQECRQIARGTSSRVYSQPPPEPFAGAVGPSPYTGMRAGSTNMWQYTTADQGAFALEDRIADSCMRHRGYDRVPIQQAT